MRGADHDAFAELSTSLAAHYVLKAVRMGKGGAATRLFEEANACLTDAEKKDQRADHLWLRKGLLLLAKGSYEAAEYQFQIVLQKEAGLIPGRLGLAVVGLCAGDYRAALGGFQAVLRLLPNGPPELRLAIGYCMAKLGFVDAARGAFERVLALTAGRETQALVAQALVAQAVLNINQTVRDTAAFQRGMVQMRQAYDADRTDPVVLNHLGNHFFFKRDYAKAEALLRTALKQATASDSTRAETSFFLGKVAHAQGRLDAAYPLYLDAVKLDPELAMAQFGLGQCLMARRDLAAAAVCFEKVLARAPGCLEASKCLGLLLVETAPGRAEPLLRRALDDPHLEEAGRVELYLALGSTLLDKDAAEARDCYGRAAELAPGRFDSSPVLLNNLAVLRAQPEQIDRALGLCTRRGGDVHDALLYNKAVLLEAGDAAGARALYAELLARRPRHLEAHLRLGLLAARAGQLQEAAEHYKEAIGLDEASPEAWALLATAQLRQRALTPARKALERLLQKIDRHDLYALTALGNLYVELGRADRSHRDESLRRALEFYSKALGLEPRNHLAAHGIGVVMAELGQYRQAKEVFVQVRVADSGHTDAAANLAHAFVELGQYGAAVHAYEQLLAGAQGKLRIATMLHLGRALYVQGKAEKQPAPLHKAVAVLTEATHALPKDAPIRFNLALAQQELAALLIKAQQAGEIAADDEAKAQASAAAAGAAAALDAADGLLASVASDASIDQRAWQQRTKWSAQLRSTLTTRQTATQSKDKARLQHMQSLLALRARDQAQQEEAAAKTRSDWEAEQLRIEHTRREMAARLKLAEEKIAATPQAASPAERTSQAPPSSRKRRAAREPAADTGAEPEPEPEAESEDEEVVPKRRLRPAGRPSALSKEFISDDEDGEGDGDPRSSEH